MGLRTGLRLASLASLAGLCTLGVLGVALGLAAPAPAQASAERITSYVVGVVIQRNGVVRIQETITYDFGTDQRHGIFRDIPYLQPVDAQHNREFPISGVSVSSPDRAPAATSVTSSGGVTHIRVGSPDRTVTGSHTYLISYQVGRSLSPAGRHDEFTWNLIGNTWPVPISGISARVSAPGDVTGAFCYAGSAGSTAACAGASRSGRVATFRQGSLGPDQGLTVTVQVPAGSVTVPPALIVGRWNLGAALAPGPLGGGLGAAVVVLVLAWLFVPERWARRRERAAAGARRGPAAGLRPGQAGVVLTGTPTPGHVVGTLVDLAIRGYLRIGDAWDHAPGDHPEDWLLTQLEPPARESRTGAAPPGQGIARYERTLLAGVFDNRHEVHVSTLEHTFAPVISRVCAQLAEDAARHGWLHRRHRLGAGWALAAGGAAIFIAGLVPGAPHGTAFFGVAVMLAGAVALVVAVRDRQRPRLTPEGEQAGAQVRSFRKWLRGFKPDAADPWAAFSGDLPYAIAFGLVTGWAEQFGSVQRPVAELDWWSSSSIHAPASLFPGIFAFTDTMCSYAPPSPARHHVTAGLMSSPDASSGGGLGGMGGGMVGGGGGGGGGGSW
jgi:hypothetical protein